MTWRPRYDASWISVTYPLRRLASTFHETERSVRTPSSEQVRQPIYRSGLEQWRNFEPWLEPLKQALGPEILGE